MCMGQCGELQPAVSGATHSAAGQNIRRNSRLFVSDKNTGMRFLADSGADVSLIPFKGKIGTTLNDFKLYAANGTEISTYGTQILSLDLGLRRQFQWPFVIAKTNRGILGADFLNNFKLILNINRRQLIDGITNLTIKGDICSISEETFSSFRTTSNFSKLLANYPDITRPNVGIMKANHDVKHFIITKGPPVFSRARPLDPKRLNEAKQEFQFMLEHEIIRPSKSQWASPLHLVTKKDGTLRPCGDYRKLNSQTMPDRYQIPRLEDFQHILSGKMIFSRLDLFKAYYQIPIAEEDKPKTAIITPFGLYEFNVMSFGLRNAPATFQRFILEVLRGLDFTFPYLDDILVASETCEEHETYLKLVLEKLQNYGLRINIAKSILGVDQLEFLGHWIINGGSQPLPSKVQTILDYKLPTTKRELRTFLGMVNFYRRYLENAASTQALLHDYLIYSKKNDKRKIDWSEEAKFQFERCKQDLASAALLCYPNPALPLSLCTDASNNSIGSVLQQCENSCWKPIAFFSKKINNAQKVYSTYDRELLGIYLSIKKFKYMLEGREFYIFTDHKPLVYAFKQNNEKASPRQQRQLQYISQFSTDIRHISGKENIVADTLSRIEAVTSIDYDEIAEEQNNSDELLNLRKENTSLKFKQHPLQSGKMLWCDVSTENRRPFIPEKFRIQIFHQFHNLNHSGIKATINQLKSKFIWKEIKKTFENGPRLALIVKKQSYMRYETKLLHTTPYHPQSNGKIERFNRTLKTAIKAHNSVKWTDSLPTILLALRAAIREDTGFSISQMVYGKTIKLPGEFFEKPVSRVDSSLFISNLIEYMHMVRPITTSHNVTKDIFIHKDLFKSDQVFLRINRIRKPLEPYYEGPYPVLEKSDKFFTLKIKDREVKISIDRLKPAYILGTLDQPASSGDPIIPASREDPIGPSSKPQPSKPGVRFELPKETRSGRRIKTPSRYNESIGPPSTSDTRMTAASRPTGSSPRRVGEISADQKVVCRTKRIRNLLAESKAEESCDEINLNEVVVKTVGSDKWSAVIIINGKKTTVHLDTGAQINVLPHKVINQWSSRPEIRPTSLKAFAYGNTELPIVGKCNVLCQYGEKKGIICLDPRKLNEALVGRHFQTPAPAELLHEIPKSKYYTVLDVKSAYWHIPVAKECRDLLEDRPLAFASASFSDSQKQYSQIEKELLCVYYGCKKFEYLLSGHTFVVQTDHQPLLPLVKKPLSDISPRLQRLVMKLIAFDFKLQYKPGKYLIVADTLSRDTHPMDELPTPFLEDKRMVKMVCVNISDEKLVTLQKDTREDPALVKVIDYVIEGWPIYKKDVDEDAKAFFDFRHRLYLWNDLLCIGSAIVIPVTQRNNMLNLLHQSHQGISAIQGLARESLFWPGMSIDIAEKVKNCENFQKYQKSKIRQPLKPFPVPDYPWQTVSLDIFYIQKKPHLPIELTVKFADFKTKLNKMKYYRDRDGVTLKHCSMAYWLKVITALLIIGCVELNPGPKRQATLKNIHHSTPDQATLTNIPHSTPDQAPMDDLKLLIINLSAEVNRLGEKMDARLLNIEQKMEVWERRMTGIETSMASCTDALATNTRLISHNTLKIRNLEERAEALERRARENNLIIYGIESAETDSRELLLQKVKKLMAEDMQITDDVVIAECHRLGRGPKAPILIEVPDHESRISLLKNSFKFRMLNIFMSRDYSPQIREQRKILIEKRKKLYKKGIGSKLRDNKLLLNGINYMVVEGQVMNAKGELI
ncbi:hypothetical protein LAZ67_X001199 [Cordylochernes scorpioides]|uniref:RNA-directed DNA polymerase n=1 Tax=Cordylochernes scorpioides TaxID=51811 RepID=A0ABY6LVE2_9ARAC|nr:hypothetical protein LAZ67_X001199 [Cordylochernes scorpioides]